MNAWTNTMGPTIRMSEFNGANKQDELIQRGLMVAACKLRVVSRRDATSSNTYKYSTKAPSQNFGSLVEPAERGTLPVLLGLLLAPRLEHLERLDVLPGVEIACE
jgi:hypothetical protein